MSDAGPLRLALRTAADVFIGLILFVTFVLALSAHERTAAATHRLGDLLAIVLLGGIFSMIVAFNLAFFRHLRREYASPR